MQPQSTSFVTPLASNVRRRHTHTRLGKQVTSFSVQIEILHEGRWIPVVRYDTAHGFAHRDRCSPSGRVDKTPLFLQTFNEALDFAESDLRSNWQIYAAEFLKKESGG